MSPSLTIVIPSYQRRAALTRLLGGLAEQLKAPGLQEGVDVLVVLDGSTDGSKEAVSALGMPVPVGVVWQANAGLAAARNRGLADAGGELVWFLDDDMVPAEGLVSLHRHAHDDGPPRLLMGPCLPDRASDMVFMVRDWAEHKHRELVARGGVASPEYFSAANTSGPRELWRSVGGFDARFAGWGGEDYEIAVRLLGAGATVDYEPRAVAWHEQERGVAGFLATKRDEGRNTARIGVMHPGTLEALLPPREPSRPLRLLLRLVPKSRRGYRALAVVVSRAAQLEHAAGRGRSRRIVALAAEANFLSGVVEGDPDGRLAARLLGAEEPHARGGAPRASR